MKRLALAVLAVLVLVVSGCSGPTPPKTSVPAVKVDTPALRSFKAKAGIATCQPGSGTTTSGQTLPDLTLPCLGGGPSVDLASLRGPLILNIWGSWCGPCRKELPILGQFAKKYAGKVAVVGIDYEDQFPAAALEQLAADKVAYPQLVDQEGSLLRQPSLTLAQAVPQTLFVSADGSVTKKLPKAFTSVGQVEAAVETYLGVGA